MGWDYKNTEMSARFVAEHAVKLSSHSQESGLEYLIDKILFEQENYFNDDGELTDTPRIQYMNGFKSHVDLTEYVNKAREIDKKNNKK